MSTSLLLLGVVFSSIGLGFVVYGRKQRSTVPLVCGLCLLVVPYVFSSTAGLLVAGCVLVATPYFVRI